MPNEIIIDEQIHSLIPPLDAVERAELEHSILEDGCRDALVVWPWDGKVIMLDGHNRLEICQKYNIAYHTISKSFLDREVAKIWVIQNQFGRRNLSPYQRSVLALKLEDIYRQRAKAQQGSRTDLCQNSDKSMESLIPVDTKRELAKVAHVSHDTIAKVKKIEENATEEQKEKLRKGEATINQVYVELRHQEKRQQAEEKRQELANQVVGENDIIDGDISCLDSRLADDSVDLFFSDPPYKEEYLSLYERLAQLAQRTLKVGGLCLVYTPHAHLPKVLESMTKYLDYWWIFAVEQTGEEARIWAKQIWVKWKPIFVFTKRPIQNRLTETWVMDALRGAGEDKRYHEWGQDIREAAYWIEALTPINGLVVDPFCGGGIIPLASKITGRRWLASEIDAETAKIARGRLVQNNDENNKA